MRFTDHCIYVESKSEIEDNLDVAWFNSSQYAEIFSKPRYLDSNNKLLAIVRIEYNGTPALLPRTQIVGNTALSGARLCLTEQENQATLDAIAKETETVELSFSNAFSQAYIENMGFDVD